MEVVIILAALIILAVVAVRMFAAHGTQPHTTEPASHEADRLVATRLTNQRKNTKERARRKENAGANRTKQLVSDIQSETPLALERLNAKGYPGAIPAAVSNNDFEAGRVKACWVLACFKHTEWVRTEPVKEESYIYLLSDGHLITNGRSWGARTGRVVGYRVVDDAFDAERLSIILSGLKKLGKEQTFRPLFKEFR